MLLIVDANVLIDYLKVDESILALSCSAIGTVHVPRDVVDEVQQADDALRVAGAIATESGGRVTGKILVEFERQVRDRQSD
ncbi:MAG: hypothetical protein KAI47_27890 [Deltaproteobacteria bacterium]|nr:hypothetical protein [Deltaproteobacteria bacterium]